VRTWNASAACSYTLFVNGENGYGASATKTSASPSPSSTTASAFPAASLTKASAFPPPAPTKASASPDTGEKASTFPSAPSTIASAPSDPAINGGASPLLEVNTSTSSPFRSGPAPTAGPGLDPEGSKSAPFADLELPRVTKGEGNCEGKGCDEGGGKSEGNGDGLIAGKAGRGSVKGVRGGNGGNGGKGKGKSEGNGEGKGEGKGSKGKDNGVNGGNGGNGGTGGGKSEGNGEGKGEGRVSTGGDKSAKSRLSGVGALWDCVPRVCGGGGGCAGGGVSLGAMPALSWCGEVSLGDILIVGAKGKNGGKSDAGNFGASVAKASASLLSSISFLNRDVSHPEL